MGLPSQNGKLAEGTVFGHYEIVRHLGSGGMGSVYEAVHARLRKRVAIKTLLAQYASNPEAQTRFLREGTLAAKIHHPHVVDVTDFGIEADVPYLVMEYLEGEDLAGLLSRAGRLFPEQLADLMVPVTAAVANAHDQQIIHRDLKPQNIFLAMASSGETVPKVLDFGISKLLNDDAAGLTGSMNLLGTPSYMSPEQAKSGKHVDARSDQYTLAVILYECVTGRKPFAADGVYELMRQIVEGEFKPPSELVPGLPPEFEAVILRGMRSKTDDRFATTWEFGLALLAFASPRTKLLWEPEFTRKSSPFTSSPGAPRAGSMPQIPQLNTPMPVAANPSHARSGSRPAPSPEVVEGTGATSMSSSSSVGTGSPGAVRATTGGSAPQPQAPAEETRLDASLGPREAAPAHSRRNPSRPSIPAEPSAASESDAGNTQEEEEAETDAPSRSPETTAAPRRTGLWVGVGLVIAVVVLGGIWFVSSSGESTPTVAPKVTIASTPPAPVRPPPPAVVAVSPPSPVVPVAPAVAVVPTPPVPPAHAEAPPPTPSVEAAASRPRVAAVKHGGKGLGVLSIDGRNREIPKQSAGDFLLGTYDQFEVRLVNCSVEGGKLHAALRTTPSARVSVNEGSQGSTKEAPYVLPAIGAAPARLELNHGDAPPTKLVLTFSAHPE